MCISFLGIETIIRICYNMLYMKWKLIILFLIVITTCYFYLKYNDGDTFIKSDFNTEVEQVLGASTTSKTTELNDENRITNTLPEKKYIDNLSWVPQSFNNCSSVGLMIILSHWGIVDTQEKIAEATRPWNNPKGNNDDKSVTLHELAMYAESKHGTITYVRPSGDIETLKKFIANDIPVLTRALMYPKDDIVHYRVIRGYDDTKKIVIETDGVEGKNVPYSYEDWMYMWKDFNYSYLIIVPKEKKEIAEKLLGEDLDEKKAWTNAKNRALNDLSLNKNDLKVNYNLITAMYYLGEYENVVSEFEKIEDKLTRRKLWYQTEPIDAYFKLEKYDRVIELVDYIANDNNKSISELYVLKGKILEKRGDSNGAKVEYEKALYYNKYLQSAKEALGLLNI